MFSGTNTSTTSTSNSDLSSSNFQLLYAPTKLNNVGSLIPASREQKPEVMRRGYVPSDSDVCCGRGKQHWNMTGNVNFRKLICASVVRYMQGPLKADKTAVIVSVVRKIRRQGGRFLKQQQKDGSWYDIGDAAARGKVGHSLRDKSATASAKLLVLQQAKEQTTPADAADADAADAADADADADAASDCDDSVESAACSTASWWI
jgi:hypothetical protein